MWLFSFVLGGTFCCLKRSGRRVHVERQAVFDIQDLQFFSKAVFMECSEIFLISLAKLIEKAV